MGLSIKFTSESSVQFPDKAKSTLKLDVNGMQITQSSLLNKDKIAITVNGMKIPFDDKQTKIVMESAYLETVATRLLIDAKEFMLNPLGEIDVNGHKAAGIKVSAKGHGDVSVYFDKETGLMARVEYRDVDLMTCQEYLASKTLSKYKEFNGIQTPTKEVQTKDGAKFMDSELLEVKYSEKLDPATFEP